MVGVINKKANTAWHTRYVRFSMIEFIDDLEVSRALLDAVAAWGRSMGMDKMQGPMGVTDFDKEGMLVEDFDLRGSMTAYYNPEYYPRHMEQLGLVKEADWLQVRIRIPNGGERLRPGMYAYTKLALGRAEAMVIPYQSVQKLTGSNERYIYVNYNGVARRVFVKLGERYDDKVEIMSDELTPGEEIIVTGAEKLVDGVTLKIER